MRRKKILILPTLKDRGGDITKKWFVEMSQRNPKTGEMVRFRTEKFDNININSFKILTERYAFAEKIINDLKQKLHNGWTIFNDTERFVYEDQTQYSNEARMYKRVLESNLTVVYWLSRYINDELNQSGLSDETLSTYKSRCRIFRMWIEARKYSHLDVTAIDNLKIIEFFTYLRNERRLAKRTYNSYIELLVAFFEFVKKTGCLSNNPVHSLPENKLIKDMGAERIRKEDLEIIIADMDRYDKQLALACRFEFYCGLRPGYETRLLRIGDIDLRSGYSKIRVLATNAKKKRRREVVIPDDFLDYLINEWKLNEYDKDLFVFGKNGIPGAKHLGKNNMRFRFNKIRKKLNMPFEYKFYSFKHTGATMLAEHGEPIINIRDHLGHKSISTTEHYLNRHGVNNSQTIRKNFPKI
ncbi:MAG: tyrosine-type recombinase/integrase [Prevotellaceae bacterium]|jgi:integrase|nr:tyrosine-type recombinase/integrase [Prevotellaceae bacterium]